MKGDIMGRYVKIWCPHCKYVIQNYTLDNTYGMTDIGEPLMVCPNCHRLIVKKNVKEVNMMTKFDYQKIWINNILTGLFLSFIVSIIIFAIIVNIFNTKNFDMKLFLMCYILLVVIVFILYLGKCKKNLVEQIINSKKRLENHKYRDLINKTFLEKDEEIKNVEEYENEGLIPKKID